VKAIGDIYSYKILSLEIISNINSAGSKNRERERSALPVRADKGSGAENSCRYHHPIATYHYIQDIRGGINNPDIDGKKHQA
jgi:hypothetical protein